MSKIYEELIKTKKNIHSYNSVDPIVLAEMSDWDNMTLKNDLNYKTDFVLVSASLWKFLQEHFKGGFIQSISFKNF